MGEEESIWDAYVNINDEWNKPIEATFESDYEIIAADDDAIYLKKKEDKCK